MSSVVISGNTSGSITLSAPDVSGSNTITLPASTGTVLTTGNPQSGGVVQVVQATSNTYGSTTSTSFTATNVTVSITPKFSTSKILVFANLNGIYNSNQANNGLGMAIYRGATNLIQCSVYTGYINTTLQMFPSISGMYLDSPATTSPTTYAIYFKSSGGGTVVYNNTSPEASMITLMEIAA